MESNIQASEDQVSVYLHENPQFFKNHADLLAMMYLPSPHGSGTVSLAERQQLAQRDKIRVIESRLLELLKFAEENEAISEKVHRLSLGLLASRNFELLTQVLAHTLREDFQVPYVGMRLWASPLSHAHRDNIAFQAVDVDLSLWTESLVAPYCGSKPGLNFVNWFGENAIPKSFALVALRSDKVFGLLAMASDDERRFYPEMGTMYLKRIGELVSASLLRYID
jgi:uncharacterized protein YigA (DUF484 family)